MLHAASRAFFPIAAAIVLGACAVPLPAGPSILALPGKGKDFAAFQQDDATCRQYALAQIGDGSPAQAATQSVVGSAVLGTALGAAAGAAIGAVAGNPAVGAAAAGSCLAPPLAPEPRLPREEPCSSVTISATRSA